MKWAATILLAAIPILAVAAERGMRVADLPLERCGLREVISRMEFESGEKAAAIAEQALPVLEEIEKINSKATVQYRPIQDQLSSEDIGKFTELTQRLKVIQLAQIMESRRERDLMVIEKMVMIADRVYRWQDYPKENDPDSIIYAAIQLLRSAIKDNNIDAPASPICTLKYALHAVESEAIAKLNEGDSALGSAMKELELILRKYGMEKLDRSRLSKSDLQKVNELNNGVINPMRRHWVYVKDVENIKLMAHASEIAYESNIQDIAFSGGDVDAIGKTIERRSRNNEFNESTQIALGLWVKINEMIPSPFIQELLDIGKRFRQPIKSDKQEK